jgi:hypothetical protein
VSESVAVRQSRTEPEFLSVAQVARRLGCSVSLVQKWRRLGWLPATRLGPPDVPVYGYRPADIERFVSERWNRQRGRPALGQSAGGAQGARTGAGTTATTAPARAAPPEAVASPPAGAQPDESQGEPQGDAQGETPAGEATERFKSTRLEPVTEGAEMASAGDAAQPVAPPPPPAPPLKTTGRPLVLWDGDPREGTAMVIARFPAGDAAAAVGLASAWARRYGEIYLCEAPRPGAPPGVLAIWRRGERQAEAG